MRRQTIPVTDVGKEHGDVISAEQLRMILGLRSRKTIDCWIAAGRLDGCLRRRGKHNLIVRERLTEFLTGQVGRLKQMSERTTIGDRVVIWKRGKRGIYQADFHYRGQHRLKSLKTSNRKVAVERATKIAVQIIEGTLDSVDEVHQPSTAQTKLASAVIDYRESNRTAGLRPKTIAKYHGTLTDFVEFARSKGQRKSAKSH